jgi:hypothetical protein
LVLLRTYSITQAIILVVWIEVSVIGQILNELHLPECEGAVFELDIRMEMKRHIEDEAR